MTERALGVERAFQDLAKASPAVQGLLRPVLMKALQDPALMRQLGRTALSQHLAVVGRLLTSVPSDGVGPPVPPLKTFLHLTIGEEVEDAEEAYDYVRSLDAPIRGRVEGALTRVIHNHSLRAGEGTISLLALARLLSIAFSNMPLVAHILDGGAVEPFLPQTTSRPPQAPSAPGPQARGTSRSAKTSDHLAELVGTVVEVISIVSDSHEGRNGGHIFSTIGRVVEVATDHVMLETLRGHEVSSTRSQRVLLGMASIVVLRTLSVDEPDPR
jgi:hypothetical protein